MPRTYRLELNEDQAKALVAALDIYASVNTGKLGELVYHMPKKRRVDPKDPDQVEKVHQIVWENIRILLGLLMYMFGTKSIPFSITDASVREGARVAYDVKQVLQHRIAWTERPDGGMLQTFEVPQSVSEHPLPKLEVF